MTSLSPDCRARIWLGGWGEDRLLGRCTFPIGPRNTISNLAYPLVGVGLVAFDPSAAAHVFALLLILLGIGSALYHGCKTEWTDQLDHAGMYAVFAGLTTYALAPTSPLTAWAMVLAAAAMVIVFGFVMNLDTDPQMGVLTAAGIIHGALIGSWRRTLGAVLLLAVAYVVWHLDRRPAPPTGLWGHAVWHAMTAVGIGLLFLAQTP
jgi:predicted membrane channel-forming protein YqfA (hemolysin III family)